MSSSPSALPPEEELSLLRAEIAYLRQELERARKAGGEAGGTNRAGGNGGKVSTRSGGKGDNGDAIGDDDKTTFPPPPPRAESCVWEADHPLSTLQVERYCRQMLLPWFGPEAQSRLASSSALIVGLGGLGCPAALYLAAAGVGRLGLCDRDSVDVSNLHRQVLHSHDSAISASDLLKKTPKVESAARSLRRLNPTTKIEIHGQGLTRENAESMVEGFDVVLDCSDNAPTRYLLSDACSSSSRNCRGRRGQEGWWGGERKKRAAAAIPLVSGAAIGGDGQLTVYCASAVRGKGNDDEGGGGGGGGGEDDSDDSDNSDETDDDDDDTPCYRCLFPTPPPATSCGSCAEAGVLGPVPGVVGVLQALEAIKLLALGSREERKKKQKRRKKQGPAAAASASAPPPMTPLCRRMLAFDGRDARFRTVQLRPRSSSCVSCGEEGEQELDISSFDYEAFTGRPSHVGPPIPARILPNSRRVLAAEVAARFAPSSSFSPSSFGDEEGEMKKKKKKERVFLLDVRPSSQFALARLPGSVNVPWGGGGDAFLERVAAAAALRLEEEGEEEKESKKATVVVVCRRGNDSQRAVAALDEALKGEEEQGATRQALKEFLEGRPALVDVVGGLEGVASAGFFAFPRY